MELGTLVGATQHLHYVLCHLRGEKGPWAQFCPDLLLRTSPSLGEAVPSSPVWGPPFQCWGGDRACLWRGVPPPLAPPLPQPLPSAGDDLQQQLLGSEPRNGQLTSTAGEGCASSLGPWGQLCPPSPGGCSLLKCPHDSSPLSSLPGPQSHQTPGSCPPGDRVFSHQFLRPEQLFEGKVTGPPGTW